MIHIYMSLFIEINDMSLTYWFYNRNSPDLSLILRAQSEAQLFVGNRNDLKKINLKN
jgi:hypothetical protein